MEEVNHKLSASSNYEDRVKRRRHTIQSFKKKYSSRRTFIEKIADEITAFFGSIIFVVLHTIWFILWLTINTSLIPGIPAFDPYPFGLLTMIVSLEAIFLSIFVLISQNREAQIADLREEINLQINMIAEEEITKVMQMINGLYKGLKIDALQDPELHQMMKPLNRSELERKLEEQMK